MIIFGVILMFAGFEGSARADTVEEYVAKGQSYYDKGDYKKAIEILEKGVDLDPNYAPAYNALGLAHQALKEPITDVAWFFKVAVDIDPKYTDAYTNMCRAYYQASQFDLAQAACEEALRINPESGQAQLSLGWIYLIGRSNPAEALRYFESVRKKVETPFVYFGMGLAYSLQGDNARVLEMVTTLKAMGANDFANQLEQDIRKKQQAPPAAVSAALPSAPQQPGTFIKSQPGLPPAEVDTGSAPISGQMRIRLRGQMQNAPSSAPDQGPSKKHPGSL